MIYNCMEEQHFVKEGFNMKIAIGCDHAAFEMKHAVMKHLEEKGIECKDFGTYTPDSSDYPLVARDTARAVASGEFDRGIVLCGTGIGVSIVANKVKGIRCALLSDTFSARATREHNDANMMAMGARVIGIGLALDIVDVFLETPFGGAERHIRRVNMINQLDNEA